MKKLNRKGFTIVELIIVIAVIAILAAVLIPTFSSIIKKANVSSDTQLIRNLNEAVAIDKAEKGIDKHDTMYDAVEACLKQGYMVDRIVAKKSSYNIAWERSSGNFILLDMGTGKVIYPTSVTTSKEYDAKIKTDYYVVTKAGDFDTVSGAGYSSYAYGDGWTTVKTSNGFDVGSVTTITAIEYTNTLSQNTILRTNSYETTLTVDAKDDTVAHYGKVGAVIIKAVADHSYIEYGDGGIIQVTDGHIVLTADSNITKIHFTKVEKEHIEDPDKFEDITVTVKEGVTKLPEMTRDSVEISEGEEIKVCTVETTSKTEDIILTKKGIVEQIKLVSTTQEERYAEYVENPVEASDKQNAAAVMLANELSGVNRDSNNKIETCVVTDKNDQQEVTSQVEITFDYTTRDFVVTQIEGEKELTKEELDEKLEERIVDSGKDAEEVIEEAKNQYFADTWDGTIDTTWYDESKNEFVITTAEQLAGFAKLVNDGNSFENKTVKLGRDLNLNENPDYEEFEGMTNWTAIGYAYGSYLPLKPFSGTFDGQGHTISNIFRRCYNTTEYFNDTYGAIYPYGLFGCVKNAVIENLIIDSAYFAGEEDVWYTNAMGGFVGVAFGDCTFDSLTLKNSYLCAYISNCGGIVGGCTSGNMTFNDISVDNTNVLTTWDWGKWSSCDCQMGGIIGQIDIQDKYPDKDHTNSNGLYTTHVTMTDCTVACQLMQMNDVMSNYAWYQYRSSGMLIGGITHNHLDGLWNNCDNVTDEMLQNALTCTDVKVVYDLWNHQYYCCSEEHDPSRQYAGDHAGRFNKDNNLSNELVGTHADGCCGEHDCLVFDQLVGGWSGGTWRYETGDSFEAYAGVNVTYLNNSQPEA